MAEQWTLADLEPEQLTLLTDIERTLDTGVVLVFKPTRWGTVDEEIVAATGLHPIELAPDQLERLQDLEREVGGVAVAYEQDG